MIRHLQPFTAATVLALSLGLTACTCTRPFRDSRGQILPDSIASMEKVVIDGISQGLLFRAADVHDPAVILLHGGPGISETALFRHYDADLEQHFLMVYWDQRGAGRSYDADIPRQSMSIAQMEVDLDAVVDLVRKRFHRDRVILLAHSWGTVLGTIYAHEHPEKLWAYVGVSQIANFAEGERRSRAWAMAEAVRTRDRAAVEALQGMGRQPRSVEDELELGRWVEKLGGTFHQPLSTGRLIWAALLTDEASLLDLVAFGRGNRFSMESLRPEYSRIDLTRDRSFRTPVAFLLGRHDWHVPAILAERYFATISAPEKRLIWFEESAHNPPFEEPRRFVQVLRDLAASWRTS